MNFINIVKKILSLDLEVPRQKSLKTLQDLEIFDTIWVKDGDTIRKGWVFDLTKKHVIATVFDDNGNSFDYRFNISRPFTTDFIEHNNTKLLLNDPGNDSVLSV